MIISPVFVVGWGKVDKSVTYACHLKGHNTQHSAHMGHNFQTEKTIEIQLVWPTEVCGKVLSEKNG